MLGRSLSKSSESTELYQKLLSYGQTKHMCQVCNRHMTDEELKPFESYVRSYVFIRAELTPSEPPAAR